MAEAEGSVGRRGWSGPGLAFVSTLVVAVSAVVTSLATGVLPESWWWLREGWILWPAAGVLTVVTAVLAWRAARVVGEGESAPGSVITAGAGAVVSTGGSAVGPVRVGPTSGGTVIVAGGSVTMPVPAAPPAARPGRVVVGELPGEPPSFQDRAALAELAGVFEGGGRVAVVCALTGARGVGKTQIAAAYAREQVVAGCPLVAWVSAETTDTLVTGLAEVARAVGVADPEGDSIVSARRLRAELQTRDQPAVLVIDNAVDADAVRRFLPVTGPTRVIVTSTDQMSYGQLGVAVDVSVFDRAQSCDYLRARTGRLDEEQDADRVAEELGDLPLALAQAASVVHLHQISYADYLRRLSTVPVARMLPRRMGDPYPKGAAEAILLSVQAAVDADESGLADQALSVLAVLSPGGVHRDILRAILTTDASGGDGEGLAVRVDEMLARLVGLSLLVWGESGAAVILHRLVARMIRDRAQATDTLVSTVLRTAAALDRLTIPEAQAWAQRERGAELVGHDLMVWTLAVRLLDDELLTRDALTGCVRVVHWAVEHLVLTADLFRATRTGTVVLTDCERVLGGDHPATLTSRNNLAGAYQSAGRLEQAITLYETTLTDSERVLGGDHPATLTSRNNLAGAYESVGRLEQAITLYETTLTDSERVLGGDHSTTRTVRENLRRARASDGDPTGNGIQ